MIDREQVLHVARLARLRLAEASSTGCRRSSRACSRTSTGSRALDLEDVPPTTHVVRLENVLREDEIEPSLTAEQALANAPDPDQGAFRVPSPQA